MPLCLGSAAACSLEKPLERRRAHFSTVSSSMYNWNIDLNRLRKDRKAYDVWKLEQMVNFGLNGKKLNKKKLKAYWNDLTLDPKKKQFLSFLLWGRKPS
jgi:hypothetical protein